MKAVRKQEKENDLQEFSASTCPLRDRHLSARLSFFAAAVDWQKASIPALVTRCAFNIGRRRVAAMGGFDGQFAASNKSGRKICGGTPVAFETALTRSAGTFVHFWIADLWTPISRASAAILLMDALMASTPVRCSVLMSTSYFGSVYFACPQCRVKVYHRQARLSGIFTLSVIMVPA